MFDRLRKKWRKYKARRLLSRQTEPKAIRDMAREVGELARTASLLGHYGEDIQSRIAKIITEMERLDEMTGKPEFRRLSPEKRQVLRQGLLQSKAQLMRTINTAAPPTETIQ
ncbi:MAG: hypothetical protein PHV85_04915 [Desulfovibrionaceae bacterium]|nr:hypothetical protein [Desulfovibrionaceae bacterium]MDD4951869.1 hypothetical protein [Desulfovibrionaceae bacterium]